MDLQKIGNSWKDPEKIFIMGPTQHFSLIRLKVTSKTRLIVKNMGLKNKSLEWLGEQ